MVTHESLVLFAQQARNDRNGLAGLHVLEVRWVVERELELRRIEHVQHDQVVAAVAETRYRSHHPLRLVVEIGDDYDDLAVARVLGDLPERCVETALSTWRRARDRLQH